MELGENWIENKIGPICKLLTHSTQRNESANLFSFFNIKTIEDERQTEIQTKMQAFAGFSYSRLLLLSN